VFTRPLRSHGCDRSSFLLCRLIRWIDVIVVWAQPPFKVSEASHVLYGEKAKEVNLPQIISGVGSSPSLQFSPAV
jgi:hypothetical protein